MSNFHVCYYVADCCSYNLERLTSDSSYLSQTTANLAGEQTTAGAIFNTELFP
jgi:hypothetical protein